MRPPWRPQRRNQRPKRSEISYLREWRRGESNRPAEDSGGRRSKLYRDLSWGCLPPTTLRYRQLVPEGQPRASASKPDDGRDGYNSHPRVGQWVRARASRGSPVVVMEPPENRDSRDAALELGRTRNRLLLRESLVRTRLVVEAHELGDEASEMVLAGRDALADRMSLRHSRIGSRRARSRWSDRTPRR